MQCRLIGEGAPDHGKLKARLPIPYSPESHSFEPLLPLLVEAAFNPELVKTAPMITYGQASRRRFKLFFLHLVSRFTPEWLTEWLLVLHSMALASPALASRIEWP